MILYLIYWFHVGYLVYIRCLYGYDVAVERGFWGYGRLWVWSYICSWV